MNWALRRKLLYTLFFLVVIILILYQIFGAVFHQAPTCTDGKKNGDESGIDCGGSCSLLCQNETAPLSVLWYRALPYAPHIFDAVAVIHNENLNGVARKVKYTFRLYDTRDLLIGERTGYTFVPPRTTFAIYEPNFDAGSLNVKRTDFYLGNDSEDTNPVVWEKISDKNITNKTRVTETIFDSLESTPRLKAHIVNDNGRTISHIKLIAIAYDSNGNAIGASSSVIDSLTDKEETDIVFTWRNPFPQTPVKSDVFIMINPFDK